MELLQIKDVPRAMRAMVDGVWVLLCLVALVVAPGCKEQPPKEEVEERPLSLLEEDWCLNDCVFSGDGECDDGGPDADTDFCQLGTDCDDCGRRIVLIVDEK